MKTKLIALAALLPIISACSDDNKFNNGAWSDGTFQTFVTYMGSGDTGSSFTVTEPGTDVLTTFTTTKKFSVEGSETLTAGQRVLISYDNASDKRYESGPIVLRGVMKIFDGAAPAKSQSEISPERVSMIDVQTVELSGEYVNIVAQAEANSPSVFGLWFDEATVARDTPDAYVVFRSDMQSSQRMLYGSFDISSVLNLPTCQAVRVHYMTLEGAKTSTFQKIHQGIQPME